MGIIRRKLVRACLALAFLQSAGAAVTSANFADRVDYKECGGVSTQAVADTNGDGIPDVICGGIQVLFGNGDGTFRNGPISQVFTADDSLENPIASDLNGDGKVDLVITADLTVAGPGGIGVTFGNGDGTFQPATFYQAGNDVSFYRILIDDFNKDGILDIVTLGDSGVWLFTGKGGGLFNPGVLTPISKAQPDEAFTAADLNGDGNLDLIASAGYGFDVLLGNGNGTFQTPLVMSAKPLPFADALVAADLNGDGKPDLVVSSQSASYSLIFFGKGDGTFEAPQAIDLPGESNIAVADVNGDGIPDLVNSGVYIAFGQGQGKFAPAVYFPVSGSVEEPSSLLVADLLNNGRADLLIGNFFDSLSVLLNQGKGSFEDGHWTKVPGGPLCAASADFNRDGKPDLAVGLSAGIAILLGTGRVAAPLLQSTTLPVTEPSCPLVGDVNGDGIEDIVISSGVTGSPGSVLTFLGNGDGTFQPAISNALPTIGVVILGDFNGDGKLDYATTSNLLGLGNGDGTFQSPGPYIPGTVTEFDNIAAGRLTTNRYSDIVLVNRTLGVVDVLLSGGARGFREQVLNVSKQVYYPVFPVLGDVNGDGFLDLVLGGLDSRSPIYLNDGTGKFTYSTSVTYALVDDGSFPLVADVNGDGIPDVVVNGNYDLGIFLGGGAMTFAAPFYIGHSLEPGGTLALDMRGQPAKSGKPDLVVPDFSGAVEVIYNTTQ